MIAAHRPANLVKHIDVTRQCAANFLRSRQFGIFSGVGDFFRSRDKKKVDPANIFSGVEIKNVDPANLKKLQRTLDATAPDVGLGWNPC